MQGLANFQGAESRGFETGSKSSSSITELDNTVVNLYLGFSKDPYTSIFLMTLLPVGYSCDNKVERTNH